MHKAEIFEPKGIIIDMTRILNFGSCNIDYVYDLGHIVAPGETENSTDLHIFPGGKGLNQSIAVARAGGKVYHAGQVGEDGDMLREIMAESGVDVSYVRKTEGRSGHAIIQVAEDGENSIFLYSGANRSISDEFIESVLEKFDFGDILILQNEINGVNRIIDIAHAKGLRVMLTPSPIKENIFYLDYETLSFLVLNETEAKAISGENDAELGVEKLCRLYPKLQVVLTLGKNGCLYRSSTKRYYHPAFKVEAVDTTAAGDTFAGYFIAATAKGAQPEAAIKTATAAAALAVSRKGAAPSIPTAREVEEALKNLSLNSNSYEGKKRIAIINGYINDNLRGAKLEKLAEVLGYSKSYTGTLIKQLIGKSFSEILEDARCKRAAELLADTDVPIEEIIYKVGYDNKSFFRELFYKRYGTTLIEFRKHRRGSANGR